jgi:hypothetical protein
MTRLDKKINDAPQDVMSERWPRDANARAYSPWLPLIIYIGLISVISAALFISVHFQA